MGVVNSHEVGTYDLTNFDHSHSNFSNQPNFYSNWPVVRSISSILHGGKQRVKQTV